MRTRAVAAAHMLPRSVGRQTAALQLRLVSDRYRTTPNATLGTYPCFPALSIAKIGLHNRARIRGSQFLSGVAPAAEVTLGAALGMAPIRANVE
jgi:hypothetical protein